MWISPNWSLASSIWIVPIANECDFHLDSADFPALSGAIVNACPLWGAPVMMRAQSSLKRESKVWLRAAWQYPSAMRQARSLRVASAQPATNHPLSSRRLQRATRTVQGRVGGGGECVTSTHCCSACNQLLRLDLQNRNFQLAAETAIVTL